MAITALNSAASGLRALSTSIDVIANNLANTETTAFKRSDVAFENLMYLMLKQPGATNAAGEISPAGIFVGLGTHVSNTQVDMSQGSLDNTNEPLNIGISGTGFFQVKTSIDSGIAYTRNGNFIVNAKGQLVVGIGDGYQLIPPIVIPPNASQVTVSEDGNVDVLLSGQTAQKNIGRIQLAQFVNPQGLKLLGGGLFEETESSGNAVPAYPTQTGAGSLLQGYLEDNVDPVKELVTLIKTQRAFEMNSQSIQTADQALQTITNLRRG